MIEEFYDRNPYGLSASEKSRRLTGELMELTRFHKDHCPEYARFLNMLGYDEAKVSSPADIPYFPVRLFKEFDLLSVRRDFELPSFIFVQRPEVVFFVEVGLTARCLVCLEF